MNIEKLTTKSREALGEAQLICSRKSHGEVGPIHLLAALLDDNSGPVVGILQRMGVPRNEISREAEMLLEKQPRVSGDTDRNFGRSIQKVLEQAFREAVAACMSSE